MSGNRTPGAIRKSVQDRVTQDEQEAATSNFPYVTPGRQHFHPSASKGWVNFTLAGADQASFNVSSIDDTAAGDWTVNWATVFSSVDYAVVAMCEENNRILSVTANTIAAGSVQILCFDKVDALVDPDVDIHVVAFGDRA